MNLSDYLTRGEISTLHRDCPRRKPCREIQANLEAKGIRFCWKGKHLAPLSEFAVEKRKRHRAQVCRRHIGVDPIAELPAMKHMLELSAAEDDGKLPDVLRGAEPDPHDPNPED